MDKQEFGNASYEVLKILEYIKDDDLKRIPQEEIEHIFQSFYRGSNTRDYAGQGIGLSLTLKIISAYHAKLDISSEIEKGTKVRVIF